MDSSTLINEPQTELMKGSGFIFIQSVLSLQCESPFQINERFSLGRATRSEVERIRDQLDRLRRFVWFASVWRYENDISIRKEGTTEHEVPIPLPVEDWRYFVIRYDGPNDEDAELQMAMLLLEAEIHLGWTFLNWPVAVIGHHSTAFQFFCDPRINSRLPRTVTEKDLKNVAHYFGLIKKRAANSSAVFDACNEFANLRHLPSQSNLQVVGCFAIIESLLTHNPNDKEVGDSLTHQLKTKIALLEKCFARPLDFAPFGVNGSNENEKKRFWAKLYKYRSCIAHGNRVDFDSDLRVLKSRGAALAFLSEVTKLVLIAALEKPEFIQDLKAV